MTGVRAKNLAAIVLLVTALAVLVLLAGPGDSAAPPRNDRVSSFYADPAGAKAIYLVLKKFLPFAERWLKPLDALPPPEADNPASLLILGPDLPIGAEEAEALNAWVERGGQLIIASPDPWTVSVGSPATDPPSGFLSRHGFSFSETEGAQGTCSGAEGRLELGGPMLAEGGFQPLFSGPAGVMAGVKRLGQGRLVVVTDSRAWSNERLRRSDNAVWLVSAALSWANGRLWIDEFHHGFQRSRGIFALTFAFLKTYWGFAFLQLAAAGLLLLLARVRRFGRIVEPAAERRQDPLERVQAIGALLEAAGARRFALRTMRQQLLRRLGPARAAAAAQRAEGAGPLTEEAFVRAARQTGWILEEYNRAGNRAE